MHLLIPWFTRQALDNLSREPDGRWGLPVFPALIALAACAQGVFRYFWRTNVFGFSRHIEWDLRNQLFAHLQRLPLAYFQRMKTGELMSRLTNDLASVREMLGIGAVAALDGAVLILAALPLMIGIDPWLTLWSLCALPGITALVLGFGNRMHRGYREIQQQLGQLSIFVQENLGGIRVVQAHAQEENRQARFRALSAEYMRKNLVTARMSGVLWPLIAVFSGLGAAVVLWLGGRQVLLGTLTIGQFVQFNGYLAMLTWPVMAIGYVVNLYQRGSAALHRLVEILETPVAATHLTPDDGSPRRLDGAIEFRDLSFRYGPEAPWVLRDIRLRVPAGTLGGHRGRGRGGQEHAGPPDRPALRGARGCAVSGRARHPQHPAFQAARLHRAGDAGHLSLLRDHRREHPLRPPRRHAARTWRRRPASRGSCPASRNSPTGSTRCWASAAFACRAGKNNGPRWPAR